MKLKDLILAVRERNLSKDQLEDYRDDLANLFAQMQFELAEIRKEKAVFFLDQAENTNVATEKKWQGSPRGLREIELSHYCKATEKILSSLKARLYNVY